MNTLATLGSSYRLPQQPSQLLPITTGASQAVSKPSQSSSASNDAAVSLSDIGIELSKRADHLGNAAIDMAQSLVTDFAKSLFGDAADGMKISFDSASVSAMSQFSAARMHSTTAHGNTDAAAMSMEEMADFVGKGQITTADGHRFNFEVEVHFQSTVTAAAASASSTDRQERSESKPHRSHGQDLKANFPGTVADLFHTLQQDQLKLSFQLPGTGKGNDKPQYGNMTLRLLELVDAPSHNAKKITDAYGVQPVPLNSILPVENADKSSAIS